MSTADGLGLAGTLAGLEDERQAALKKSKQQTTFVLTATALFTVALFLTKYIFLGIVVLIGGLIATLIIRGVLLGRVRTDFKRKIMPVLLRGIDPSLQYDPARYVGEKEFNQSNLFQNPDRYSGKDLMEGKIGATAVRFSLIHAEEKYQETETDSDGKTSTHTEYRTIFSGLFFVADFNKHFSARTKVEPHSFTFLEKLFGSHVELESPEFNKLFAVSSTDQVEARYILTPSLMDHFMALRAKIGEFKAAFADEHVFMALNVPYNAFEPSLKQPLTESGQVEKILFKLNTITGIVEDLGLNVRIWTKE